MAPTDWALLGGAVATAAAAAAARGDCRQVLSAQPSLPLAQQRDLGSPILGRATLPPLSGVRPSVLPQNGNVGVWLCPKAPWTTVMRTWRALARRPASRAGPLHNLPQLCSKYCVASRREFQDLVHTRTNLPACCLAAGRGVCLRRPREIGGVFASKRAWPASRVGAAAPPSRGSLCVPNRSFLGSPGPGPGHRGGSSGDILDTGFEQEAWPGAAPASGCRAHLPAGQPGVSGSVWSWGQGGHLPGAGLGLPGPALAPPLLF